MRKKIKEEQGLRKDHVKKPRIKILKIKEHQVYQKSQKRLIMKTNLKSNPINLRIFQITKKMIFKIIKYQLILIRKVIMDPIDNKWQIIQKMMDNKLLNNSI